MVHKQKTVTVRLPKNTLTKLKAIKKWKGEPHYSVIERLMSQAPHSDSIQGNGHPKQHQANCNKAAQLTIKKKEMRE